jgi:hypothetical protein
MIFILFLSTTARHSYSVKKNSIYILKYLAFVTQKYNTYAIFDFDFDIGIATLSRRPVDAAAVIP